MTKDKNTNIFLFLIDLLNSWSSSSSWGISRTWCSWHASHSTHVRHPTGATSSLVHLGDDGVANAFDLLELVIELFNLCELVGIEPLDGLVAFVQDGLPFIFSNLVLNLLVIKGGFHVEAVGFEAVLARNSLFLLIIIILELLGLVDHAFDVFLGQTTLVVGDGDLVELASGLVNSGYVEDTVGINVEGDFDLGNSAGSGWDSGKIELAKKMVVLGHRSLSLIDLDGDSGLVVAVGGEGLGLLGGDGGVPLDERSHDSTSGLNTKGKRCNVEEEEIAHSFRGISGEDGSLNCSSIGNSLVRIDRFVELLSIEEILEKLLDLGNPGGSSNEHQIIDARLVHLGISHGLLYGLQGSFEQVRAELLEPGTSDAGVEVDSLEERVDFNVGLSGGGEGPLGTLASSTETTKSTLVALDVLLVLPLELLDEVVHHAVVEVLASQMGVSSGGLDLEDALLNGEDGHIEGSTTEIEDEDIAFGSALLLVKAIGDGSGGGFVNDPKYIEAGDHASILGGLSLGVVEVGGDRDDSILDIMSQVGLSCLLHLHQNHGGDLLRGEGFLLILVLNLELRLATLVHDLEGPMLHVALHGAVGEVATDKPLGIEDGVGGVDGHLVLCGVPDEPLSVCEGDIAGSGPVTLVVGDDLDLAMLEHANAGVGGAKINTNGGLLGGHFI